MTITPIYDKLLITPIPVDDTIGKDKLIIIAETHRPKPQKGTVLAAGEGYWDETKGAMRRMAVAVGDVVLYGRYAGQTVTIDNEDRLIIREEEVRAIERPSESE